MNKNQSNGSLLKLASEIVSAYVATNTVRPEELPRLIGDVHDALAERSNGTPRCREPWVPIAHSVKPDYIVCLEDGKKLKMLKRHLSTAFNMSPADYRRKWGLPDDYPMVAPSYAEQRRKLAETMGFGRFSKARTKLGRAQAGRT